MRPTILQSRRRTPRPRLSSALQHIGLRVLPASAVLTRATPPSLAWVATPLALARSLLPPGPHRALSITQGRALGAVLMVVSVSALLRGAIATPARRSDRQRPVPTAVGPGTPHPSSGPRGAHSSCPLPNLHPTADRRTRATPQAFGRPLTSLYLISQSRCAASR